MKCILLSFVAAAVLLVGCGGGSKKSAVPPRKSSNEIVVGIAQDLDDSLDAHKMVAAGTREVMFNVFEGLVKPTTSGGFEPAVAQSYSVSDDGLVYTFVLRDGILFHNENPVTMRDVVFSIDRCRDGSVPKVAALEYIKSLEARGNNLVITLSEAYNEFISFLTLGIIPYDYDRHDTMPIGTGPFKYVSRAAQDNVVLEKFEGYWGAAEGKAAKISRVTFKVMENPDSAFIAMKSGAVDMAKVTPTRAKTIENEFNIESWLRNIVQALYINHAVPKFADVRVRQAMCYAVDKYALIDLAFDGYGKALGSSMYPSFEKYFDDSLTDFYTQDTEKAKALLAEAGYPDGIDIKITAPSNYKPHVDTAEVLVEQFSKAGIRATIETVEWKTWLSDIYLGRKYETTVIGVDAANLAPSSMLSRFVSTADNNFTNYKNAEYDALFAEAQLPMSDEEQVGLYKQMEKNLTENAANVYLQDLADLMALRKGLAGSKFYPLYAMDLSGVYYE